jgi:Domain of unknown function (DUF4037)
MSETAAPAPNDPPACPDALAVGAVPAVAAGVAGRYAAHPAVRAVALGGSLAGDLADDRSDLDLYVYADPPLSLDERAAVAAGFGPDAEVGNAFWEPGDEWADAATGVGVDVMFRSPAWVEGELARVLDRHEASVGYSTAIWHNVRTAVPLFDRDGWFGALQANAARPYPEELRRAIVVKNHPILRRVRSAYRHQLGSALARGDDVAVNHRTAAFLASLFDVLFALNRRTHPGEKRLLDHAEARCPRRPPRLRRDVTALLAAAATGDPALLGHLDALVDALDRLVAADDLGRAPAAAAVDAARQQTWVARSWGITPERQP